jgi:phage regulator Rha-like protein
LELNAVSWLRIFERACALYGLNELSIITFFYNSLCDNYQGEEYKLFWPEQSEFIRIAAKFGAKIIPFGAVGEDDLGQVSFSI